MNDGVLIPRARSVLIRVTRPEIDHGLPVDDDRRRRADLEPVAKILGEGVPNPFEFRRALPFDGRVRLAHWAGDGNRRRHFRPRREGATRERGFRGSHGPTISRRSMTSYAHDDSSLAEAYDRLSDSQFESGQRLRGRSQAEGWQPRSDVGCGTWTLGALDR